MKAVWEKGSELNRGLWTGRGNKKRTGGGREEVIGTRMATNT